MRCGRCGKPSAVFQRAVGGVLCRPRRGHLPHASGAGRSNASRVDSERMAVLEADHAPGDEQRDAGQDYPQSPSEAPGIRVRRRSVRRAGGRIGPDGRHPPPRAQPTAMLGLRTTRAAVRPPSTAPVRVRAALGLAGVLLVRDAARRLSQVRADRRAVPWADGKHQLTTDLRVVPRGVGQAVELAGVAPRLPQHLGHGVPRRWRWRSSGAARIRISTEFVAIGFDEIHWQPGHRSFLTLVYQITAGRRRLLWIGQKRTKKTARAFFRWFGKTPDQGARFVCSDMWDAVPRGRRQEGRARRFMSWTGSTSPSR